jgi:ribosomal protein S30
MCGKIVILEIEKVRKDTKGTVPEERLKIIARKRKISEYAKELLSAQSALSKSDFNTVANKFH